VMQISDSGLTGNAPPPARKPSTMTWFSVHVLYPMLPVFIEGSIRCMVSNRFALATYSSPTLSISLGLLSMFMNQNLLTHHVSLSDPEEEESLRGAATLFLILAVVGFALFAAMVLLHALIDVLNHELLKRVIHAFELAALWGCIVTIIAAYLAQRSFKLKAIW
jgi:hypothetical protein